MFFSDLPRPIYDLPTYLLINFLNNILKNNFNLGIKLTMLNGPQSTNQIVNHFVNHSATQNNKV